MSVLSISDFFLTVKDWFSGLPALIEENIWIRFGIIAVAAVIAVVVIALIAVSVKKSRAKRKSKAEALAAKQTAEAQPVEEVAATAIQAPSAEAEQPAIQAPSAEEGGAEALWKQVLAEVFASAYVAEGFPDAERSVEEQPVLPAASEFVKEQAAQPAKAPLAEPLPAGAAVRTVAEDGWYVRTLYNRSFMAKLIQSDQAVKDFYSVLKNGLLAYGAAARISWKHESFRVGRNTRAKFVIRGKTLCLCLALDAADFAESKYLVDDMSKFASYAATPLLYRIKNARRCRYAAELIAMLFGAENRTEREEEDFSAIPYRETFTLVEEGLIKIVRTERVRLAEGQVPIPEIFVTDEEDEEFEDGIEEMDEVEASAVSSLMDDEYAKSLLAESSVYSDKTRQSIVNIEVLGRFFEDGETVTLQELKKRVPIIDKRTTYIKVLARGTLNKALVVIADDFSLEAVKMIALTGGRAVRNKRK